MRRGFVYFKYRCITAIIATPMSCALYIERSWLLSYSWMVVVTSFGSSPEPNGAGSTYLRVVRSRQDTKSDGFSYFAGNIARTFLLRYLRLHVEVDAENEQIRHHV